MVRRALKAKWLASQLMAGGAAYVGDYVRAAGSELRQELDRLARESLLSTQRVTAETARHGR